MRLNSIIPLIAIGVFLGFSFAVSDAFAHAPSAVTIANSTERTIAITWTHTAAGACATSNCTGVSDVDILRDTTNILNNSTDGTTAGHTVNGDGTGSWIDGNTASIAQGTTYAYKVCHGDTGETDCSADTTNAAAAVAVSGSTEAATPKPSSIILTPGINSVTLTWAAPFGGDNNTDVSGYLIQRKTGSSGTFSTIVNSTTSTATTLFDNGLVGLENCTNDPESCGGGNYAAGAQLGINGTGLQSGQQYFYRIYSLVPYVNAFANGDPTPIMNVTTLAPSPQVISSPSATQYSSGDITGGNLQLTVSENSGWDRTLNIALHTNITAGQTVEESDTSIVWNFFDPVVVTDPHNYFNEVNVVTAQSGDGGRTMDVTYEITWNKPLAKSDAVLETSNFPCNIRNHCIGTTTLTEAWTSFPVKQVSYEIPEETSGETIMTLFDGGVMNHLLLDNNIEQSLLSDMQYFVNDDVVDVSQDEVVLQEEEGAVMLFENVRLSQDNLKVGPEYYKTLVISGTVKYDFHQLGEPVTFSITSPDGTESQITAVTTSDRTFKVPIVIEEFKSGTYQLQPIHSNLLGEPILYKHSQ